MANRKRTVQILFCVTPEEKKESRKYEYMISAHVDKDHIHNHIIFNAANFVDHHKYVSNKRSYRKICRISNRLFSIAFKFPDITFPEMSACRNLLQQAYRIQSQ